MASRGTPDLSWQNTTLLDAGDLVGAIRAVRERHQQIAVVGSLNLVQTLLRERLFDRLDLWIHPIVLGAGKKVFDGGAVPTNLRLLAPPVSDPVGTVHVRYALVDGVPATGDMTDRGQSTGASAPNVGRKPGYSGMGSTTAALILRVAQ